MSANDVIHFEYLIVGAGYAGSMLATILARNGRSVLLVDKSSHPRFTVGESSTPIADHLLRELSQRYAIPEWDALSNYGSWRNTYPQLRCGLKRGFSYYCHVAGHSFSDDAAHSNSLLVAASNDDFHSDTHWLRADVDQFLCQTAVRYGANFTPHCNLQRIDRDGDSWKVAYRVHEEPHSINVPWIIDASGSSEFARQFFKAGSMDDQLRTSAKSIFGHFIDIKPVLQEAKPLFDPNAAAQHHIVANGWLWFLRFDDNLTSVGFVTSSPEDLRQSWQKCLREYPGIRDLLDGACLVDSTNKELVPATEMRLTSRLSRCNHSAAGVGWVSLPSSCGFIDPLHSTGIAHSLLGVLRLSDIFLSGFGIEGQLQGYSESLVREIEWIDTLVALCYAGLPNTRLFKQNVAGYFTAVVNHERRLQAGEALETMAFLSADHMPLRAAVARLTETFNRASSDEKLNMESQFFECIKSALIPFDSIGFFDPMKKNRIPHHA